MRALLGIDLGTSSVKVVVSSLEGAIEGLGTAEYPILTPQPGYAEQNASDWWNATVTAVRQALHQAGIAVQSVACLLAVDTDMANVTLRETSLELGVPLRFADAVADVGELVRGVIAHPVCLFGNDAIAIAVAEEPLDPLQIGRPRGRLAVIGLGPGACELMVPAVKAELARANDVLGYETYVRMAGPYRADQVMHSTDKREEMQRARHAFQLAAQGRSVVVVSSGDPGVFAMASAVLEALLDVLAA